VTLYFVLRRCSNAEGFANSVNNVSEFGFLVYQARAFGLELGDANVHCRCDLLKHRGQRNKVRWIERRETSAHSLLRLGRVSCAVVPTTNDDWRIRWIRRVRW